MFTFIIYLYILVLFVSIKIYLFHEIYNCFKKNYAAHNYYIMTITNLFLFRSIYMTAMGVIESNRAELCKVYAR